MAKIYVASSFRNGFQPQVVSFLREMGHEVYDFRNPPGTEPIQWNKLDPHFKSWSLKDYQAALNKPQVKAAFQSDFEAMKWADYGVLVMPSGRSANSEAGWMKGAGKGVVVYSPLRQEPDLMYLMYDKLTDNLPDLNRALQNLERQNLIFRDNKSSDLTVSASKTVTSRSRISNAIVLPGESFSRGRY